MEKDLILSIRKSLFINRCEIALLLGISEAALIRWENKIEKRTEKGQKLVQSNQDANISLRLNRLYFLNSSLITKTYTCLDYITAFFIRAYTMNQNYFGGKYHKIDFDDYRKANQFLSVLYSKSAHLNNGSEIDDLFKVHKYWVSPFEQTNDIELLKGDNSDIVKILSQEILNSVSDKINDTSVDIEGLVKDENMLKGVLEKVISYKKKEDELNPSNIGLEKNFPHLYAVFNEDGVRILNLLNMYINYVHHSSQILDAYEFIKVYDISACLMPRNIG